MGDNVDFVITKDSCPLVMSPALLTLPPLPAASFTRRTLAAADTPQEQRELSIEAQVQGPT